MLPISAFDRGLYNSNNNNTPLYSRSLCCVCDEPAGLLSRQADVNPVGWISETSWDLFLDFFLYISIYPFFLMLSSPFDQSLFFFSYSFLISFFLFFFCLFLVAPPSHFVFYSDLPMFLFYSFLYSFLLLPFLISVLFFQPGQPLAGAIHFWYFRRMEKKKKKKRSWMWKDKIRIGKSKKRARDRERTRG